MERIFVDTSAWIAYANRADPDHARVRDLLRSFRGRRITSNFVFDETVTFCRYRFGHELAADIGNALLDARVADLIRVTADDERQAWLLMVGRPDQRYSFTDCTSFALMRRLRLRTVAALDQHFRTERFEVVPVV
ncbi:MAG: type II toxin-antitoxin system VapC family toxin [Candidatus Binatia bacterium]